MCHPFALVGEARAPDLVAGIGRVCCAHPAVILPGRELDLHGAPARRRERIRDTDPSEGRRSTQRIARASCLEAEGGARMDVEEGFTAYVSQRRLTLFRTACLLCGDPHQAEDIVQDA